jgi:FtsP/CotA-like multicopper oxidase with cupredoxin domain
VRVRWRAIVPVAAALAVLGPVAWFWQDSLVPDSYSVMDMGYADTGGGPGGGHQHAGAGVSVAALTGPRDRSADVAVTLVARAEPVRLADGTSVAGYTLNHTSPGPEIRAEQGRLVEVTLVNESVADGVSLHWHGVDVPNAEDGVAGVTQDAVPRGGRHVYRFVAEDAGTYWYHSHQVSHEQVRGGLYGVLVVTPRVPAGSPPEAGSPPAAGAPSAVDQVAVVHTYGGRRTIGGRAGVTHVPAPPGSTVRVRVVNSDQGSFRVWVTGSPYRVLAVDARDVNGPTPVTDAAALVTAGARADVEITVPPAGAARVDVGARAALTFGSPGASVVPAPEPKTTLDHLTYGTAAPLGFDPAAATRRFEYNIGRRPGFLDGRPGLWWTINGRLYPEVPMYVVSRGDVVRMTISNGSGKSHPMHLHGHHAVVLSRNGTPATGSPWWVDSLDVPDGDRYEIAFRADNPGIWVDHCHHLDHAAQGLLAHLAYTNVTEPYRVGGRAGNRPE